MPWIWTDSKPERGKGRKSIPTIICWTDRLFLVLFLQKKKKIHWTSWSRERQIFSGECSYNLVVSYWGLVSCVSTALSKCFISFDRKVASLPGEFCRSVSITCGSHCSFFFGTVGLINLLQWTVWRSLRFQFICLCHLRGQEEKNKSHWSFSPAAMDESFMASLSAEGMAAALAA